MSQMTMILLAERRVNYKMSLKEKKVSIQICASCDKSILWQFGSYEHINSSRMKNFFYENDVFDAVQELKEHFDCNDIRNCPYVQKWWEQFKGEEDCKQYNEWLIDEVFGK